MALLDNFLKKLSDGLHSLGDALNPRITTPARHIPPAPIGEIRKRKHKGKYAYFWLYEKDGKRDSKYLSRDKEKAELRREELSGWLLDDLDK